MIPLRMSQWRQRETAQYPAIQLPEVSEVAPYRSVETRLDSGSVASSCRPLQFRFDFIFILLLVFESVAAIEQNTRRKEETSGDPSSSVLIPI